MLDNCMQPLGLTHESLNVALWWCFQRNRTGPLLLFTAMTVTMHASEVAVFTKSAASGEDGGNKQYRAWTALVP